MAKQRPFPVHLGGPLGLAGLSMLAGAAGLLVIAGDDDKEPTRQVAGVEGPLTTPSPSAERPDASIVENQVDTQPPKTTKENLPANSDTETRPVSKPSAIAMPASADGTEIIFIVRLKGPPEIDVISRNYKRDQAMAEDAFRDLSSRLPTLKEFQLVGASYSGELKLSYQLAPGVEPTRTRIDEIRDKILSIEGVAYADPDYVAHPGKDER